MGGGDEEAVREVCGTQLLTRGSGSNSGMLGGGQTCAYTALGAAGVARVGGSISPSRRLRRPLLRPPGRSGAPVSRAPPGVGKRRWDPDGIPTR
ncbi:hypothetical protein GCM10023205_04610 [Yinghuangia aomiensis]|uniref:Uncharacterized protein n=1 Tax=Yinghuangia aomiensis TaxID=676205 RepID=A0ABP9GVD1_9ACTN